MDAQGAPVRRGGRGLHLESHGDPSIGGIHFFSSENHPFFLRKRALPCMDFHFHAWIRKSIMDLCIHDGFTNPSWICASMVTICQAPSFSLRKEIPQKITLFSPQKQIHSPLPQKHASMQTRHGFPSEKPCFPLRIHGFILVAKSFDGLVNLDHSMCLHAPGLPLRILLASTLHAPLPCPLHAINPCLHTPCPTPSLPQKKSMGLPSEKRIRRRL